MENIIISKKKQAFLLSLSFILNVIIRIPSIPHEKGVDSFFIHLLATSLSLYGEARWWINTYSIFGLFPYSYASSAPYSLSGIEQLANVNMEHSILIYCVLLGLFSMFSMYLFAGVLYNNFLFKYVTSMLFSLSQGMLLFTTWEVSGRGVFLAFFPIFLYLILNDKTSILKKGFLSLILMLFLFATHHFVFFTIPLLIIYLCLNLTKRLNLKRLSRHGIYIYIIMLITVLIVPFFIGLFVEGGSRYAWIIDALITTSRWIGPLIFFTFGGLISVLLNREKSFGEWYILISLLIFIPMLYSQTYGKFLIIPLVIIFISIAIMNIIRLDIRKKKCLEIFVVFILLLSASFSGFFNHVRLSDSSSYWYMSDEVYSGGIWAKNYVPEESHAIGAASSGINSLDSRRISAIAEGHFIIPSQGAADLAYGLADPNGIKYVNNSYLSKEFYFEGPYTSQEEQFLSGSTDWILEQEDINSNKIKEMMHNRNVTYILERMNLKYNIMPSVYNTKDRIYDSGFFRIHVV
ncbi:hypothetical protein [Methanosarcina sp.]|uniref:hypothetical protein n=1 Tax=Methanosarcina sp. TaxID=2213 RepID=UPI002AB9C726|nr:hypothetical protein [Methanosarcina sp.]MDY9926311.1 hypothetical protein [Methanosarcina sp.]